MRTFLWFIGLIALGMAGLAALGYPIWQLLAPVVHQPFHRVATRVGEVILAVGFWFALRHLGLANRRSLGYELPRRDFRREAGIGIVLGVLTMLPVMLAMFALGLREPDPEFTGGFARIVATLGRCLLSGITIGLIEETFIRGAMQSGITREAGTTTAIVLCSLLYAATHFFTKFRIPDEQVGPGSGLDLLAGGLANFAHPLAIADAFLCLAGVGVLLGIVRAINGNIAACVGLHAGWVTAILFMREASRPNETSPLRFLTSQFDGVVGWLILAFLPVIGFALQRFYRGRVQGHTASGAAA
jgi:membrane protease YdiL (CAAX protease family)